MFPSASRRCNDSLDPVRRAPNPSHSDASRCTINRLPRDAPEVSVVVQMRKEARDVDAVHREFTSVLTAA